MISDILSAPRRNATAGSPLTKSQHQAMDRLHHFARMQQVGLHEIAGIATRPHPLIIGPSGCGKTFLVNRLANSLVRPVFAVNLQNWIVRGARCDSQVTMEQLADFVHTHDEGILFIDEVNKLNSNHAAESAWTASVLSEILALLDLDDRLDSMGFKGLSDKLRNKFLIIGAAAFQDEWHHARTPIGFTHGFSAADDSSAYETAVRGQKIVPDELLFRFNDRLVVVAPPSADEFSERIRRIHSETAIPAPHAHAISSLSQNALASGKMMRWLEGYAAECISHIDKNSLSQLARKQARTRPQTTDAVTQEVMSSGKKLKARDYADAFSAYTFRLDQLASSAVETGMALKELIALAKQTNPSEHWSGVLATLIHMEQQAHATGYFSDKTNTAQFMGLGSDAQRLSLPSLRDENERGALAESVNSRSLALTALILELTGVVNRHNAGAETMAIFSRFVIASRSLKMEYGNLLSIALADYDASPRDDAPDIRVRWLFNARSN